MRSSSFGYVVVDARAPRRNFFELRRQRNPHLSLSPLFLLTAVTATLDTMFIRSTRLLGSSTRSTIQRPLSTSSIRFANPATTSDVGTTGGSGDATTAEAKNSLYPVFMAIGVASIA